MSPSAPLTSGPATGKSNGAPASPLVPAEFLAACGKPGSSIVVRKVPVTVEHRACDLTGVIIRVGDNGMGATVPGRGEQVGGVADVASGYPQPAEIDIAVDAKTGDVTVSSN